MDIKLSETMELSNPICSKISQKTKHTITIATYIPEHLDNQKDLHGTKKKKKKKQKKTRLCLRIVPLNACEYIT